MTFSLVLVLWITFYADASLSSIQNYHDLVVVGSTMMDFVAYSSRIPKLGETISGESFQKNFGGKGANQAVMAARLAGRVSLVSKIGHDSEGDAYLMQLKMEGVDINAIERSSRSTGIACITVDNLGSNTIVIIPGANLDINLSDIDVHKGLILNSKVLLCQNEIPTVCTYQALQIAQDCHTISILNPAPVSSDIQEILPLLSKADILCPNEVELSMLTSLPTETNEQIEIAVQKCLLYGTKVVIVTLGSRGAYYCRAGQKGVFFPVISKVNAIDTVGAGDSFIGTLGLNIARGCTLTESIQRALGCASISVTRRGAQCSYPNLSELPLDLHPPSTIHKDLISLTKLEFRNRILNF